MLSFAKHAVRKALVPLIYRYPPSGLQPERLQVYLSTLIETRDVPGAVVEIGCNLAGTSVIADTMIKRLCIEKSYYCVDTFGGFVPEQFDKDIKLGTPERYRRMFSANSRSLVQSIVNYHDCGDIRLIEKDCTTIVPEDVPEGISVCLLDVDLSDPVYRCLKRIWPMLSPGGVILVDDCPEDYSWKARVGLEAFCAEADLVPSYAFGLGVLRKV